MTSPVTAEALIDLLLPSDVQISPTGSRVVYTLRAVGHKGDHADSSIWIANFGQEHSARQLTSGSYNDQSPQWSPDGKSIAFISDRAKRGNSSVIYLLPINEDEPIPLTTESGEKSISAFRWSPDGQYIAYTSPDETSEQDKAKKESRDDVKVYGTDWQYNRLRVVNLSTRDSSALVSTEGHIDKFAWSPDSQRIIYTLQGTPEPESANKYGLTLLTYSLESKISKHVLDFPPIYSSLSWNADGVSFVAGYTPTSAVTSGARYHLSVEEGKVSRVLGDTVDAKNITGSNGRLYTEVHTGFETNLVQGDCLLYTGRHDLAAWNAILSSSNPRKSHLAIVKSTFNTPPELYSFEAAHGSNDLASHQRLTQLSNHNGHFRSDTPPKAIPIYCKSSDNKEDIDALFIFPATSTSQDKPATPLPTIVQIHGGPTMRWTETFQIDYFYWGPLLLANNYACLMVNYRGSSGRGDKFAGYARGGMGGPDYEDVLSLVDAAIAKNLVDPNRIVVGGWSSGGALAYLCAARNNPSRGWDFKGAICGAGVSDWDMMSMSSDIPTAEAEMAGGAPWEESISLSDTRTRRGSAIWHMRGKGVPPILILHGEEDIRIPLSQATAFRRACEHYEVPCEMAVYPREGHFIGERAHLVDMCRRVLRFCERTIGDQ